MDESTTTTPAPGDEREQARRSPLRRRTVTIVSALLVLAVAGVAFAQWLTTGEGTGTVAAGEASDLIITVTPDEELYPATSSDITVGIGNADNPYDVQINEITLVEDGISVEDSGACSAGDVTWSGDTTYAQGELVVEAGGDHEEELGDAITMNGDADDDCQSAQFEVTILVSGEATG